VTVVVVILRVSRRLGSRGWAVSLGLLLGGASGNLVDRLFRSPGPGRGAVVDFIDFQVWPSFNVADSAIVTGGAARRPAVVRGIELDGTRARRGAPTSTTHDGAVTSRRSLPVPRGSTACGSTPRSAACSA
jgi:signal peptidase II